MSAAVAAAATGVLALGACSGGSQPTQTAPPASRSGPTASQSATGSEAVPDYPGATVVTRSDHFVLLRSGDPVGTVGSFYVGALARQGWRTVSKYQGRYSVHLMARRGDEGVTVQVSPTGSGSSISITTYGV